MFRYKGDRILHVGLRRHNNFGESNFWVMMRVVVVTDEITQYGVSFLGGFWIRDERKEKKGQRKTLRCGLSLTGRERRKEKRGGSKCCINR